MKQKSKITAADVAALRTEWRNAYAAMEAANEAYRETGDSKPWSDAYDRKKKAFDRYMDASSQFDRQN